MDIRRGAATAATLELRERNARIRRAARKGKTTSEIAKTLDVPLKIVEQILAPIADARLSDPAHLLNNGAVAAGHSAADIQVYWVGFLTASGRLRGQGASSTLVVTLGDRSQKHMDVLMEDLATPQVRREFCRSSLLGWELYVRDQSLCNMLLRWGIPSELHGEDPGVLDDLPQAFVAPFLRGYLDGSRTTRGASRPRSNAFALYGTEPALTAINTMIRRTWRIESGKVTARPPAAELKFSRQDEQAILSHLQMYSVRVRDRSTR